MCDGAKEVRRDRDRGLTLTGGNFHVSGILETSK